MITKKLIYVITLWFLFAGLNIESVWCQAKTNVVTKEINRTFQKSSKNIVIDAEKADISIYSSTKNEIEVNLKLVSKHPDIKIANEQLSFLNYVVKESRNEIYIRNYILINNESGLTGTIHAIYKIGVPKNSNITIKNMLGNIDVNDVQGNLNIEIKYGNLNIVNSEGNYIIEQHVGNLFTNGGTFSFELRGANTSNNFNNVKGSFNIRTNLGSINFGLNDDISNLSINSTGTELNIRNTSCTEFNWEIKSESGLIFINDCSIKNLQNIVTDTRKDNSKNNEFKYMNSAIQRTIRISNKYSNIFIN